MLDLLTARKRKRLEGHITSGNPGRLLTFANRYLCHFHIYLAGRETESATGPGSKRTRVARADRWFKLP